MEIEDDRGDLRLEHDEEAEAEVVVTNQNLLPALETPVEKDHEKDHEMDHEKAPEMDFGKIQEKVRGKVHETDLAIAFLAPTRPSMVEYVRSSVVEQGFAETKAEAAVLASSPSCIPETASCTPRTSA